MQKKSARYLRWVVNLSLVLVSLVSSALLAEIVLMAFLPNPIVWRDPQESYVHDPDLIHRLKPNQHAFTHSFPLETNSYGLRNGELSLQPSPNTLRILCVGDSLTFGNGVRSQDTYPKQLEALLNSDRQKKYEVINAGVPAYDTWQEIAYLKRYGWQFKPNLVIIGFYANDIVPRPKNIPQIVDKYGSPRRAGLVGFLSDRTIHLFKRSRLLLFLKDRYGKLVNRLSPPPEYRHQYSLLNGTADESLRRGWREIDDSFAELSNLSRNYAFDVILVIFPMADQIVSKYPNAVYPAKVKEIAHEHNIRFIDMAPVFAENFSGFGSLFIEWDGHPNAKAYNLAAREIARYISLNHIRTLS
jgi:lysophospholipase L1-like esterase